MSRSHRTPDGYSLHGYPGCFAPYRGRFEGLTVYVVGRNTPVERLFPKSGLADASAYARAERAQIEALPTADLCAQAIIDVYG